ncbi:replication initiation and membrane attachment family protein [Falsibacillus pallidus]|uniref:Replicative DNA helicase loader DnaB n=1 Tax=Falsibacillus pallidus TaxID=493781 RepID=A0A370GKN2_9BACI|nr:replication initiation and membrane attachment family protein [Falsibacillus pallidus]RDI44231.1 replicative DNA helicase loader DnaB [Falsibacillus pallidus]
MKQYWNEIKPVDAYQAASNGMLHEYDRKVISFLYQPLIGPICYSLYMTLWNQVEENRLWAIESSHYHLMNLLSLNLTDIYEARLKLEGIGLLKVFVKENGEDRSFIYELQPPLSPEAFFSDGMLNVYLYRKLGKNHFLRLKQFFTDDRFDGADYKDITREFQDVFSSGNQQQFLDEEAFEDSRLEQSKQYIGRKPAETVNAKDYEFDFDLLLAGLQEAILPKKALTKKARSAIEKLAFLYRINAVDMKKVVISAVTNDQEIDIELLRKAARDWYQMENGEPLPQLIDRMQPALLQSSGTDQQEDRLIQYFENTSPRQLLTDISKGAQPSKADLMAVEEVLLNQNLPPGVVNVLIQYVMLKTDMKLSKSYMEKIASHWARKNIKTVKDAMDLAKKEHKQYQDWASGKKETSTVRRKKPTRTEQLPDWFNDTAGEKEQKSTPPPDDTDLEAKRQRLQKLQEKYKK